MALMGSVMGPCTLRGDAMAAHLSFANHFDSAGTTVPLNSMSIIASCLSPTVALKEIDFSESLTWTSLAATYSHVRYTVPARCAQCTVAPLMFQTANGRDDRCTAKQGWLLQLRQSEMSTLDSTRQ